MVPRRSLRFGLGCLLVVLLVGTVAPVVAAPPPRPLCDACGDSFEATAEAQGLALTVERSTATVTVRENGSATWVVRNRLGDSEGAERLRTDADLRTRIADRAMWDAEPLAANVSSSGVVTLRYREADFAHPTAGGALRSDEFTRAHGYRNLDGLGADRLVVVAPPGKRVGWTVPGATVSEDGQRTTLTELDDGGFVTFVPRDAALGPLWSAVAVGSVVAPVVATNLLVGVGVPTATFALFVGVGVALLGGRSMKLPGVDSVARPVARRARNAPGGSLALVGVAVTLGLLAAGGVSLLGSAVAPLFGVGIALSLLGVAVSRPEVRERLTYRTLVVGAGLGALVAGGTTVALTVGFDQGGLTYSLLTSLPFLAPVFALLPAGYAVGRGNYRLGVGTAAAGFALTMALRTSLASPVGGFGLLLVVFGMAYAAGIAVVGSPLLVAGASLAADRS